MGDSNIDSGERTGGAGSRYTDVMAHSSAQSQHEADSAASPEAAPPRRKHTAFDRFLLRAGAWFARHTRIRALVVGAIVVFALVLGLVLLIFPNITDGLEGFGYAGVFLINLLSTSTLFIPVPGLTATAQALIIREGKHAQFPWLVGITGGLGMGLGEITLYYAGYLGAELVKGHEMHGPHWLRAFDGWLHQHHQPADATLGRGDAVRAVRGAESAARGRGSDGGFESDLVSEVPHRDGVGEGGARAAPGVHRDAGAVRVGAARLPLPRPLSIAMARGARYSRRGTRILRALG